MCGANSQFECTAQRPLQHDLSVRRTSARPGPLSRLCGEQCWLLAGVLILLAGCQSDVPGPDDSSEKAATKTVGARIVDVFEGDNLQEALDEASLGGPGSIVRVHDGTYGPRKPAQAFLQFNARHDGVTMEAVGDVVLTAVNMDMADPQAESFPAIVNHVVYFGDGISSRTSIKGFTITGANSFITQLGTTSLEPAVRDPNLQPGMFFFADGGAIKVFGRSYPTIENMRIVDNVTRLCGAGISIEHRGFQHDRVTIRNCLFRNNLCPGTGAAVDVLERSCAVIENCLFVGNIANTGMDEIAAKTGLRYNSEHGCGALTVFPGSRVEVHKCTFTDNWNGIDDRGTANIYQDCIFWMNTASDGSRPGEPYEIDILHADFVKGCRLNGTICDLRQTLDPTQNTLNADDPEFDAEFVPRSTPYADVGYRPVTGSLTPVQLD